MTNDIKSLLFSPAIALTSRMTFAGKFALLGLIALAALSITRYSLYINLSQTIERSYKELDGLVLIRPLAKTVQIMQQYRGLSSAVLSGIDGLEPERAAKEREAEAAFADLENRLLSDSKQQESWKNIKAGWKRIQADGMRLEHNHNFNIQTRLVEEMLLLESAITDEYGLTADPDLEAFYLSHTLSHELMSSLEYLGRIRASGTAILGEKKASEQERVHISTLIELLDYTLNPLTVGMEKAARYNPGIRDALFATNESFKKSTKQVVEEVRTDILSGHYSMQPSEFFDNLTVAIDSGYTLLYQTMLPTTERLIQERIGRVQTVLATTAAIALSLLLLVAYFMAAIYYTTLGSIRKLSQTVIGFVRGDMRDRVHLETRDELRMIGHSFNEMADEIAALTDAREAALNILQKIADRVPGVVYQYRLRPDGSSCVPFASKALHEIYGVNPEDVREDASKALAVTHPDDMDGFTATIQASSNDLTLWHFEYRLKFADGSVKWLLGNATPQRETDGSTLWHGFITDITERKHAAEALNRSETRLRTLYDSTSDAVMMLDEKGFLDCNRATLAIFGCATKEEFCSKHPSDLSPPAQPCGTDSMTLANQEIATAMEQGSNHFEWMHKRLDTGDVFPADVLLNSMVLDGEMVLQATVRDITSRKQVKNALMLKNLVFDESIAANSIADLDGVITEANEMFLKVWGYSSKEDVVGKPIPHFLNDPNDAAAIVTALDRMGQWEGDYVAKRKNGSTFFAHGLATTLQDENGKLIGYQSAVLDITERKLADEALNKAQSNLIAAQQLAKVGSWEWDVQNNTAIWSDETYRLFEIDKSDLSEHRKNFLNLIIPEDRAKVDQALSDALDGVNKYDIEYRVSLAGGKEKVIHALAEVIRDTGGNAVAMQVTVQDITARKQAETALRESEAMLQHAQSLAHIGHFKFNPYTGVVDGSDELFQIFGLTRDEFQFADFVNSVHPEDRAFDVATIESAIERKAGYEIEHRLLLRDGTLKWIRAIGEFVSALPVEHSLLIGTVQDITERKNIENELRQTKERYDFTTAVGKVGTWDWNTVTGTLVWSDETFRLMGFAPGSVTPSYELYLGLVHPEDREALNSAVQAALHDKKPYRFDCRIVLTNKNELVCHVTGRVEFDAQDQPIRMLGTIQDITESYRVDQLLSFISQRGWVETGYEFLPALAQRLGQLVGFDYAIIGKLGKNAGMAETAGLYAHGAVIPNLSYSLAGTPCENVIGKETCIYPRGIQQMFPADSMLAEMKAESYLGVPLWDSAGQPLGLIAILGSQPLDNADRATILLKLAAASAGAELERMREENTLRKLSLAVEQSPNSIVITDLDANIEYVNQAFVKETGYSLDEAIGQTPRILNSGKNWKTVYEEMWACLARGEAWKGELINRRKDGSEYIESALISPVCQADGGVTHYLAIKENITGRKKNELMIERLSRTYLLLSRVNEAIVRAQDKSELFVAICNAAEESELFRFVWVGMLDEQRLCVMPVAYAGMEEGYTDKLNIRLDDEFTGNGPTGRAVRGGMHVVCQDIESDPSMAPWRDEALRRGYRASGVFPVYEGGRVSGSICVYAAEANFFTRDIVQLMLELAADVSFALDVFAEKKYRELAENEIRRINIELEQRVLDRTIQLEIANKELEAFSYSVSHDLRAPLRSIEGFSRILHKKHHEQLDATGQNWLERICRASQHMGHLIEDMLKLSLVVRGQLNKKMFDLSEVAEDVANSLSKASPERQVRFIIRQGLPAHADPGLLRIVINNLLGNAFKFTGKKAGAEIEFGACDVDGESAFFVRDNGDGFDMKYADKLFGAFQRLHSESEFEGTGIGLATVQRVILRHNGKVWADAKEGQGATFYFTLPQREWET